MNTVLKRLWRTRQTAPQTESIQPAAITPQTYERELRPLESEIAPNDPLLAYLLTLGSSAVVEVDNLKLDSPGVRALKAAGIQLIAPLVEGETFAGIVAITDRRSDQDYATDDRKMFETVLTRTQPALRVAQLAQAQRVAAEKRGRIEEELRVARVIQETLLPKEMPHIEGWKLAAFWQPAREVSGDFYDFINLPEGKLGIVEADVTGKGVPAALVMATTRALLRGAAERLNEPGAVLKRVNELLCPDIPPNMFVTCWYGVLDSVSGRLTYANAGHNPPCMRNATGMSELKATGMPLGLMDDMEYVEKSAQLNVGDCIVVYSDGLVEAHAQDGSMLGFPHLRELMATASANADVIALLRDALNAHVGPNWEPEDDVTLVTLEREPSTVMSQTASVDTAAGNLLTQFTLASAPGNEREGMQRIGEVTQSLLPQARLEKLKTAVAEATMNAMEHGNGYHTDKPVELEARVSATQLVVRIADHGAGAMPAETLPDLDLKLAGLQSPRGWGLYLIRSMVDDLRESREDGKHVVELVMNLSDMSHER